jgi:hypothetical protein
MAATISGLGLIAVVAVGLDPVVVYAGSARTVSSAPPQTAGHHVP